MQHNTNGLSGKTEDDKLLDKNSNRGGSGPFQFSIRIGPTFSFLLAFLSFWQVVFEQVLRSWVEFNPKLPQLLDHHSSPSDWNDKFMKKFGKLSQDEDENF